MRFRNWLLTGTSLTLLALAPISVARAQDASDPALVAAYQAYQASQDDASKQALTEACIAAGFQSLDDCIAALSKTAPVQEEKAAPPPASEEAAPPPPPSQEAAPAPASEEAAPPPPSEAVAPSSEAAPPASSEEPKAKPKPKPKKPAVVSSSEEAAPVATPSEEAAPVASSEAAPAVTEPSSEAAPVASSEEAAPAPSSEQAAPPASSEQAAPASSEQPAPAEGAPKKLIAAVDLYNQGVADLTAGDANGQKKIDKAKGQIDKLCTAGGFADTDTCLAQFGLVLNPLPAQPGEPSSSEAVAPPSQEAAPASEAPISELPNASEAVTPSAVEVLPPTVAPSEAAPILDSAKDNQTQTDKGQPAAPDASSASQASSSEAAAPTEPAAPPPTDDKQAQTDIKPPPADDVSAVKEKGKKRDKPPEVVLVPAPADTNQDIKVIQQPAKPADGNGKPQTNTGVVIQIGVNIIIRNPEQERDRYYDPKEDEIYYEDLSRGRTRETVVRPNGVKIVTVRSRHGDILQRSKILKNGREIVLATYDPNDNDLDSWKDPGDDLPPLRLTIPADQYILDADSADEDEVSSFLDQPPVEQVRRIYTIDEIKRSARLRDSVRRLEVGGLTFDTGRATISRDQVGELSNVAKAMQTALDRNEGEVFLIEGHTDAVGSDVANLVLSDQRAATVARILTDFYDIPAENLVTQGYGERYLKVKTDGPEPLNRRVTIKRITPLISYASAN